MFGFGPSFHQACLNELARSLTHVNREAKEKERLLLGHCPSTDQEGPLNSRSLNAVVALGLYILKNKKLCSEELVDYLIRLLHSLPSSSWLHYTRSKDGLLTQDFNYKLCLILNAVAVRHPQHASQIVSAELGVVSVLVERVLSSSSTSSESLCLEIVPSLLGLCMALSGNAFARWAALAEMFSSKDSGMEIEGGGELSLSDAQVMQVIKMVCSIITSTSVLQTIDQCADQFSQGKLFPFSSLSSLLHSAMLSFLKDTLLHHQGDLDSETCSSVFDLAKSTLKSGTRELSTSTPNKSKSMFVVRSMCTATEMLVWAIRNEREADIVFQTLSNMLSVYTSRLSVTVSPLRAIVTESLAVLAEKFPSMINPVINRFSEFLQSTILQHMCCDADVGENGTASGSSQGSVVQQLMSNQLYTLQNFHISRWDAFSAVQEALSAAVGCVLKAADRSNSERTAWFIGSLGNKLYTSNASDAPALRTAECIVTLLGSVGVALSDKPGVVSSVVAVFQQRLFRPASQLDGSIVTELGKMAASLGDPETLNMLNQLLSEALDVATTPYPTKEHASVVTPTSHGHIFEPVMDALVHVAAHLPGEEQRMEFMFKVMQSFVQQGIEGKKASERRDVVTMKSSSSSFSLGLLLPVLATLSNRMERIVSPNPREFKLFRDFWLYCILLGFSDSEKGMFPPSWYSNVRDIAAKSPLLILPGAEGYLEKELELSHPLKKKDISINELQEARLSLSDTIGRSPDLDKLVYRLTFAQCMFLQSIYRLEAVRLEKNTQLFPLIFHYLENKALQRELWVAMEAIATKLFNRLILLLEAKPAGKEVDQELTEHAQLLMFKFSHIRGRIRKVADHFLSLLVDKFPHLLWSKPLIHMMLDLLHCLSLSIESMDPQKWKSTTVSLPDLPHSIKLPDRVQKREETVVNFAKRCGQIIELAIDWAPQETKAILESYVSQDDLASQGLLHHSGISMATFHLHQLHLHNSASMHLPALLLSSRPSCLIDTRSHNPSSILLQASSLGALNGLSTPDEKVTTAAKSQLKDAIHDGKLALITKALYHVTSLLISGKGSERPLLHILCHEPVNMFREDVITIATHCWQWLVTEKPNLEYAFTRELCTAWLSTVVEKKGIFSPKGTKPSFEDSHPHSVLIKFFHQRLNVFKTRSSELVSMLSGLFHQSLTLGVGPSSNSPQYLNPSITTAAVRFQFLHLGLSLLKGRQLTSILERTLLRERLYNSTLDYFSYEPSWVVGDLRIVRETMSAMIEYWKAVREMKNTLNMPQNFMDSSQSSTPIPRNSSFWLALATENVAASQGNWLSSSRRSNPTLGVSSSFNSRRSTSALSNKNKVLLKRKNLLLSLLRHEIERLSAWQNPSSQTELNLPGEDVVMSWSNPTQSERHWKNTVTMAYQASPHLAFHLSTRFKTTDVVVREVARLVQYHPVSFVDIPHAAQCLARKEAVEKNSPELYHLLYWRNVPPTMALCFFNPPYSNNSITAQFANKIMLSFRPEEILLYIPQLVQALRYDKLGFAKQYILAATKISQLLAHQFLWNMQANMYTDEEGKTKDAVIGDLLEQLSKRILDGLSGAALKFYEREFSFFKLVTDISGTIRPFPKPERKTECLKALRQIQLQPGVYLPSNPDSVVVDIDYNSGVPLQSAAKAPFLAKFKVKKFGIDDLEGLNMQEEKMLRQTLTQAASQGSVWQGSIFKVGDDVRQDMLALQIIQLFKDVFDGLGLDLFLVPYRVVATAAGSGVIECVPDSKSRDQLGKQTQVSLKQYFCSVYGQEDSLPYQEARSNFIRSMAAYSLVSYLLQIKDRHNGNIMLDTRGHIIHIDFGFLFESSPGGNLGFEPDLKLTEEMLEVMGGKKSDSYRWFLDLCVQGYLAIRPYQEEVVAMVMLMLDTGLPCFRGNTIEELRTRFRPLSSEKEAAKLIIEVVESSCLNFRTKSYDLIQDVQQNIYYYKKST